MSGKIKIELITNYKHCIPELAELWINELGSSDENLDINEVIQRFIDHCNQDQLPLAYVAIYENKPVGMVCLRITEGIQNNLTPWLGGLVVHVAYRGRHIGKDLISAVKERAKIFGYSKLYLLTYQPLVKWYETLGWQKIGSLPEDTEVTIMATDLDNKKTTNCV